jgi:hypothetical protein
MRALHLNARRAPVGAMKKEQDGFFISPGPGLCRWKVGKPGQSGRGGLVRGEWRLWIGSSRGHTGQQSCED